MRWACNVARIGRRLHKVFFGEEEEVDAVVRIILKWILDK
jgi:hypothetical protein